MRKSTILIRIRNAELGKMVLLLKIQPEDSAFINKFRLFKTKPRF